MTKKKILHDHKREGKTFVPPFRHMLGPLREISWVKTILPELLWIALIQNHCGNIEGVEIITSLNRVTREFCASEELQFFATISSFEKVKSQAYASIQGSLEKTGELSRIREALLPLFIFYPDCPLRFLRSTELNFNDEAKQCLEGFKKLVERLYDKTSRDTMMVQATAVWLAFDSGILKVSKGLALASFPEIEKYPHAELSQKVAASIRSTVPMFFSHPYYSESSNWPHYFWNRNFEIDRCYFEE